MADLSLDDHVSDREQLRRHGEAECFRRLDIDGQFEFGRLEDGNVAWFRAFQNLKGGAAAEGRNFEPVVHAPPASTNSPRAASH